MSRSAEEDGGADAQSPSGSRDDFDNGGGGDGGGGDNEASPRIGQSVPQLIMDQLVKVRRSMIPDITHGHLSGSPGVVEAFKRDYQMKRLDYNCPPVDYSKKPDVRAASVRGICIFFVRWQLHDVNFRPLCRCGSPLLPKRWSIAQSDGKAKPMLMAGAPRGWTVPFISECPCKERDFCKASGTDDRKLTFSDTDPFILEQVKQQLGRHVLGLYPVDLAWQLRGAAFTLDIYLSREIEHSIVTVESGDAFAQKLKLLASEQYDEHAADYESHVGHFNANRRRLGLSSLVFETFPSFETWLGRESPGGDTIRTYYMDMWYRNGRDFERNVELQAVRFNGDAGSSDHTYAMVKNINQPIAELDGLKVNAVYDVFNNTTGEIATALCVTSEAVGEFAHGANQLKIARCDHIGCMFTDTWPTSENELKLLYNMVDGRLGAFHWMRRLTGALRDAHCDFGGACSALSLALFKWNEDDITMVDAALQDGRLGNHSLQQIAEMKSTGK